MNKPDLALNNLQGLIFHETKPKQNKPTHLCELAFSHINIKSKYRSTMTNGHLESCLRLATNRYCSNNATLADSIQ